MIAEHVEACISMHKYAGKIRVTGISKKVKIKKGNIKTNKNNEALWKIC